MSFATSCIIGDTFDSCHSLPGPRRTPRMSVSMTNLSMTRYAYTINGLSRGLNSQESVSIPRAPPSRVSSGLR